MSIIEDGSSPLSVCSPSSSWSVHSEASPSTNVILDAPVLLDVIRSVAAISPVAKIARLNEVCSGWRYWTKRILWRSNDLLLEIPVGNKEGISVQGSYMETVDQALECVGYILSRIGLLQRLNIRFRGPSIDALNAILDFLLANEKVQLESLLVSGRRGGLRVDRLSLLMAKCASTLKVAGTIGISEFENALVDEKVFHLERLSLTNHDLLNETDGIDGMAGDMRNAFLRICSRHPEIHVRNLSISAVNGFNPAIGPYNQFLRRANVDSLHVSLQSGDLLDAVDVTPSSVLPSVRSFEIERFPNRLHLPTSLRSLFPSLQQVYVSSLQIPLKDLEQAFAYAAEWLTMYADRNLSGVLSTEVHYEYDPLNWDKIRCHLEDIDRCGGRLRLLTSDGFCRCPTQFIVLNSDCTFQFTIHCTSDVWILADLLDLEFSSVRSMA